MKTVICLLISAQQMEQRRLLLLLIPICMSPFNKSSPWRFFLLTRWRHKMETFSALLALCAGNSPVPVNSQHKGQWRGALMFSLICVWINGWVNARETGDLRRYRGHYDVIIMNTRALSWSFKSIFDAGALISSARTNHIEIRFVTVDS